MAEIDTYSPRKVTEQNKDRLPSTHDPKKRITYVQITLNEEEIAEAIRNWIRAQVPINDTPEAPIEMPVEMIAGRGSNGHSANVTIPMGPVGVSSPERPTEPMQEFTAAAEDARRRNAEEEADAPQEQEAPSTQETAPAAEPKVETSSDGVEEVETQPDPGHDNSGDGQLSNEPAPTPEPEPAQAAPAPEPVEVVPETEEVAVEVDSGPVPETPAPQTPAAQPDEPAPQAAAPKKSSLFDTPSNSLIPAKAPEPKPEGKRRSIFDD